MAAPTTNGFGGNGSTDLDTVLDLASIVSDDEGGLHDGRELDVAVPLMLPLELIQQSLVGGLRETETRGQKSLIWRTMRLYICI